MHILVLQIIKISKLKDKHQKTIIFAINNPKKVCIVFREIINHLNC